MNWRWRISRGRNLGIDVNSPHEVYIGWIGWSPREFVYQYFDSLVLVVGSQDVYNNIC